MGFCSFGNSKKGLGILGKKKPTPTAKFRPKTAKEKHDDSCKILMKEEAIISRKNQRNEETSWTEHLL